MRAVMHYLSKIKSAASMKANSNIDISNSILAEEMDYSKLPKIRLEDNIPLNPKEWHLIEQFCDIMNAVKAGRQKYIAKHKLNEDVVMPKGLAWCDMDDWGSSWRAFRIKDYDRANIFRIEGNVFSDRAIAVYQSDAHIPYPNEWDYRFFDMARVTPEPWIVKLPLRFGEIGWNYKGAPINWTTTTHQERVSLMYASGVCGMLRARQQQRQTIRAMEVGGGAGEIGYVFSKAIPGMTWYDCDLPESLIHNTAYLATVLPEKQHYIYTGRVPLPQGLNTDLVLTDPQEASTVKDAIVSIPNFLIHDFLPYLELDYAFNTWSFSEMNYKQVEDYGHFLKKTLGTKGVLLEQNLDLRGRGPANYCKEHFAKIFPYRYAPVQKEYPDLFAQNRFYGGELDIWGNINPRELLKPTIPGDAQKVIASMWRRCGLPWAYNSAPYLRDVLDEIILHGAALSQQAKAKAA